MANTRINRINSEMQTAITYIIKNNLKDPRLDGAMISVLRVDTSNDLSHAKVFLSIFAVQDKEKVFNAIKNGVPYIRRQVAQRVKLRAMPQLHFVMDDSLEYAAKIDSLIDKINKDK